MNNHEPPMHLDFAASTTAPPRLLHSVRRRASTIRRVGPRNRCPQQSCTGRGIIRFLRSNLCDCLHASSSSSPQPICLFVRRVPRIIAFNANSIRPIVVFIQSSSNFVRPIVVFIRSSSSRNRKSRTVFLSNHILHI
jgi:hypothetical protein